MNKKPHARRESTRDYITPLVFRDMCTSVESDSGCYKELGTASKHAPCNSPITGSPPPNPRKIRHCSLQWGKLPACEGTP
jgi:hypothetical protein